MNYSGNKQKYEIKNYWKQFDVRVSSDWVSYYSYANNLIDPRYIPDSLFFSEFIEKLNPGNKANGLADKNLYDKIFPTLQPKTIFRKINSDFYTKDFKVISLEEVVRLVKSKKIMVIKPSNESYGGKNIHFVDTSIDKKELNSILSTRNDLIGQEALEQHNFFNDIHPSSLNTLRIVTLLVDGEPRFLSTMLRMGQNNSKVDNYSAGGLIASVNKDGTLNKTSVQSDQKVIAKHPSGFVFEGKRIPNFNGILNDVKKMHLQIPFFKLVSWDYSLDKKGNPVLIEGNFPSSQIDLHQLNIGPIFGNYTERVLNYIYHGDIL